MRFVPGHSVLCERSREWISLWLDGELSELAEKMLQSHLARCAACRTFEGDVPSPINPPSACWFHPRCPRFHEGHCDVETPPLKSFGDGHVAACHYPLERWPMTEDEIRHSSRQPVS